MCLRIILQSLLDDRHIRVIVPLNCVPELPQHPIIWPEYSNLHIPESHFIGSYLLLMYSFNYIFVHVHIFFSQKISKKSHGINGKIQLNILQMIAITG